MKWTRTLPLLLALGGLALFAPSGEALERDTALGAQGELYQLRAGAYGELFADAIEVDAGAQVLALDVTGPEGEPQRYLVPETEGLEEETLPALVYEDESHSVFLVWSSRINALHSIFKLASFDGRRFSDPIDVTGNPYAAKNSPQLVITHDSYDEVVAGQTETRRRKILHLAWEEEKDGGSFDTFYTPVVLEDGVYLGWNPVYRVNDYSDAGAAQAASPLPLSLLRAPALQTGRDGSTVVLAFASPRTGRLNTVEIDLLPRELVRLADSTRATIIDTGLRLNFPSNLREIANQIKGSVLSRGTAFHPEVVTTLADRVYAQIVSGGSQNLVSLAGTTRATIIDTGYKLSGRGLRPANRELPSLARTVEFSRVSGTAGTPAGLAHVVQFRIASSRPAPAVGSEGRVRLFMSENGDDVVVSWQSENRVLYRDSTAQGWGEVRELRLSANLDLTRACQILEQRARNR